ncbi:hypothetical protein [Pseudomonas sp. ok266]|uniref:hypothetical protein n=1 Tax=Pseudomonas sp. ok266 TaxID=1761896 RepID=UPI0008D4B237|nr:hypothetical protein [Pseudomonas sp. ok266]SEN75054.1 hypothetical protein SAMN04487856_104162 [Pseudomonas sp. ok266]
MIKKMLVLLTVLPLAACSNQPSSAFDSGWTSKTNEEAYANCGSFRFNKGFQDPSVIQRLVESRQLTAEQAAQAVQRNVKVGDPECLAFAAYGLDVQRFDIYRNNAGETTARAVTYSCSQSDVPCPGLTVTFSDGKVVSKVITNK